MQKSGHVYDDVQVSALDEFHEMDGRKSRFFGEALERCRGEDAGDLERIELVKKWTSLNAFEKKLCKLNPKVVTGEKIDPKVLTGEKNWRTWKSNQNTVMGEELVQNIVMDEEEVQNIVMDEELVQNVAMGETSWRTL